VVPGTGDHGPEAPEVRLHEETSRVHRRSIQGHVGHQALREYDLTIIAIYYSEMFNSGRDTLLYYTIL